MLDRILDKLSYRAQIFFLFSILALLVVSCTGNGVAAILYVRWLRSQQSQAQVAARPTPLPRPAATPTAHVIAPAMPQSPTPTPTAASDSRLRFLVNDTPDYEVMSRVESDSMTCKEDYCTTKDDRLLFIFPNVGRDLLVVGRPSELQYIHDLAGMIIPLRDRDPGLSREFLQREVVDGLCSAPKAFENMTPVEFAQKFDGYWLVVRFDRVKDEPNSGWACFVFVEYR